MLHANKWMLTLTECLHVNNDEMNVTGMLTTKILTF